MGLKPHYSPSVGLGFRVPFCVLSWSITIIVSHVVAVVKQGLNTTNPELRLTSHIGRVVPFEKVQVQARAFDPPSDM